MAASAKARSGVGSTAQNGDRLTTFRNRQQIESSKQAAAKGAHTTTAPRPAAYPAPYSAVLASVSLVLHLLLYSLYTYGHYLVVFIVCPTLSSPHAPPETLRFRITTTKRLREAPRPRNPPERLESTKYEKPASKKPPSTPTSRPG